MQNNMLRNQVVHEWDLYQHRLLVAGKLRVMTDYVARRPHIRGYEDGGFEATGHDICRRAFLSWVSAVAGRT